MRPHSVLPLEAVSETRAPQRASSDPVRKTAHDTVGSFFARDELYEFLAGLQIRDSSGSQIASTLNVESEAALRGKLADRRWEPPGQRTSFRGTATLSCDAE